MLVAWKFWAVYVLQAARLNTPLFFQGAQKYLFSHSCLHGTDVTALIRLLSTANC